MASPTPTSVTETFSDTNSTSHLVNMPATVASGDLLVMFFTADGGPTITDVWTQQYKLARGTNLTGACYALVAAGTEGGTTVDVVTSATEAFSAQVYRYLAADWFGTLATGVSVGTAVESANTGSTAPDAPAVTASWGSDTNEFITVLHNSTGGTITVLPTNYTNDIRTNAGAGTATASVVTARRELTAGSDDPPSWTSSTTGMATVTNTIVIRPAAAGGSSIAAISNYAHMVGGTR